MTEPNPLLLQAIRERRRIRFTYRGRPRVAEPRCYGVGTKGTELLRARQVNGGSAIDPLFDVAQLRDLELLDDTFEMPRAHYRRDDSAMATIWGQL